jgi:hypothetical protein
MAFLVVSSDPLVIQIERGTPFPGRCPECEVIVPWNEILMVCWNCGLEGNSELFDDDTLEFQKDVVQ